MAMNNIKGKKELIAVSAFLTTTLALFAPLELYITNRNELWFDLKHVIWYIILSAILTLLATMIIGFAVQGKIYRVYINTILGLSLAFYLQGNYLNNDYGVLDGKAINWNDYRLRGLISLAIWFACILLPYLLRSVAGEKFSTYVKRLAFFFIAIQTSTIAFLGIQYKDDLSKKDVFYMSNQGMFEFSAQKNVVVFCLDGYDLTIFEELLEQYPEFHEPFSGFTFYNNTLGMYPTTKASIPFMLTGKRYRNEEPFDSYTETAYEDAELYDVLTKENYKTSIYEDEYKLLGKSLETKVDNLVVSALEPSSNVKLGKLLYQLVCYKYMPQFAKSKFWVDTAMFNELKVSESTEKERFSSDNIWFKESLYRESATLLDDVNVFKFYHLTGMHVPYNIDENINRVTDSTYLKQAVGVTKLTLEFLEKMKSLGIYDNSMIVILADHGTGEFSKYSSTPLLLVKYMGQATEPKLIIDESPISYMDVYPTIVNAISPNTLVEKEITDYKEHHNREREFLSHSWTHSDWKENYLSDLQECRVYGWNAKEGLISTTRILGKGGKVSQTSDKILNKKLDFRPYGAAESFFISGLSYPDGKRAWLEEKEVLMYLNMPLDAEKNVQVSLNYSHVYHGKQFIRIMSEHQILFEQEVTENGTISFIIPSELIQKRNPGIKVVIECPDATSPKEAGESDDDRDLSIMLKSVSIKELP